MPSWGFLHIPAKRFNSNYGLEQKQRLLHLEFFAVKTPKKGSKHGAKLWCKSSGTKLPGVRGFCDIKKIRLSGP
jgi:hypothetical protein